MEKCWKPMKFGKEWGPEWRRKSKGGTEFIRVMFDDELDEPSWIVSKGYVKKEGKIDSYTVWDSDIVGNEKKYATALARERIEKHGGLCKR